MPKNQMTKILENPKRHEELSTYGYGGVLAGLFARILAQMDITVPKWLALMQDFVNDSQNGTHTQNQKDRTSMRGNLTKEFSRPQMTWKVFIKGLRFLQVMKFQITITALHRTGQVTQHSSKMINIGRGSLNAFLNSINTPDDAELAELHQTTQAVGEQMLAERLQEAKWQQQHEDAEAAGQRDMFDAEAGEPQAEPVAAPAEEYIEDKPSQKSKRNADSPNKDQS